MTYQHVKEIEEYTISLMRQVAFMGYQQAQLLKGQGGEWTPEMQDKLQRLYDFSQGVSTWREGDLASLNAAKIHLEQFGGSPKRKERGLAIIDLAMKNKREERR